jgi:16S rRNA processing protein RimM
MKQEYFEIGQIVNTFGIKGLVKVKPFTDDLERFEELKSVFVVKNKELIEMQIEEVKYHKNLVLIKFKGIEDMNMAEKLKGCYIKINRKDARKLPEDTYFIADLIGIKVYDDEGNFLGKVDDIYNNKVHDIYVIKDDLGKQILLPSTKEVIKDIDIDNDKIVVHLINGLI